MWTTNSLNESEIIVYSPQTLLPFSAPGSTAAGSTQDNQGGRRY
jgi:hypothetical protein